LNKSTVLFLLVLFHIAGLSAQQSLRVVVLNRDSHKPIEAVVLSVTGNGTTAYTDSTGTAEFLNLPMGEQTIVVTSLGYYARKIKFALPVLDNKPQFVLLEQQEEEIEEVVVVSTRANRNYEDDPTRIDVVTQDEMEERSLDKPSSITHAVKEQPGVQLQRTSASSGTFKIRLQGLNGSYVQLVKDGFPLFGGFSNSFGMVQISPMNLKQIEIIKGPSSVLFGGDAISGVINLVSKEPDEDGVYDVLLNAENTKSADAGVYLSKKIDKFGFTLLGNYRYQHSFDWNSDNFSDYPSFHRYSVSPNLFFFISENIKLEVGTSYTNENRVGGTMQYIRGKNDSVYNYFERNMVNHSGSTIKLNADFGESGTLTVKGAFNYFKRKLSLRDYAFSGNQMASLAEVNYRIVKKKHDLIAGIDFRSDKFSENNVPDSLNRRYSFYTPGFFLQYIYKVTESTSLSAGVRVDYNNKYGIFPLPQLMVLHKFNEYFSTRVNGGAGYKLPTVFRDASETANFRNVLPVAKAVKPEWSAGGTLDLSVHLPNFNGLQVKINQMFFYTHIFNPITDSVFAIDNCLTFDCAETRFVNVKGNTNSKGLETGVSLSYRGFNAKLNYTFIDHARNVNNVRSIAPLTSKHQVAILAGYELFGKFTVGIDAYYFSKQKLSNGATTRGIWELGINTQLDLKYVLIFANLENVLDIRQSRYSPVVSPNPFYSHPQFAELYAPLEGTILNVGFKLRIGTILNRKKGSTKNDD
jgi:iron complex outermembrane receptor protein